MEGIFILLILVLAVLVILPIVAMVKAHGAFKQVQELRRQMKALEEWVAELHAHLADRGAPRTEDPAPFDATAPSAKGPAPLQRAAAPPPLPPSPAGDEGAPVRLGAAAAAPDEPVSEAVGPAEDAAAAPAPAPEIATAKPRPPFDWEQFMGAKLFAWVGGLALFLGLGFFVKYAFDQDLVPPELRVALGFAAGAGLLVGGFLMDRRTYTITSHTLCATGILVLYATTYACRTVYHFSFFGVVPTFLVMVLVTAVAFLLAVRLNAVAVAVLGLVGGFLTPILIPSPADQTLWLFGYVALLNVGLLAVTLAERWNFLAALAAAGTVILQWMWVFDHFSAARAWTACLVFLGFAGLQNGVAFYARRRESLDGWFLGAAAAMAASAFFFAGATLPLQAPATRPMVFLSALFGASFCLLGLSLMRPGRPHFHAMGAVASLLLLAAWIERHTTDSLLPWVLGACFLFAVVHSAAPLVLARLDPARRQPRWFHGVPLLTFFLILIPVLRVEPLSLFVWPVVLAINVIIVIAAVLAGAAWLVGGALLATLAVLAFWTGNMAPSVDSLAGLLTVVGGFSVMIAVATFLLRNRLRRADGPGAAPMEAWEKPFANLVPHLPAVSAALPFALLLIVVTRFPLVNPSPVFALALALAALMLGLSCLLRNGALPLVGVLAVAGLQIAWQSHHLAQAIAAGSATGVLLWHLAFFVLFAVFPFAFRSRFADSLMPWIASAASGPLHFFAVHSLVRAAWPNEFMGLIPALFAVPSIVSLLILIRRLPALAKERPAQLAWFGGVALFFITLIFPIQFSREWVTVGWALEGAALLWLFHRIPHPGLRLTGAALLAAVFVRLALNPAVLSYHPRGEAPILNWYLYVYAIGAACQFAGAFLLRPPRNAIRGFNVPPWLAGLGTVLLFLLVNIEIADFFTPSGRAVLTFEFSGNFGRDMSYTIAWALFALVLLAVGLFRRLTGARLAGLGLLAVALAKLFLHDLANLPNLYRIGALIATAVIAIVASFLYQKLLAHAPVPDEKTDPITPPATD